MSSLQAKAKITGNLDHSKTSTAQINVWLVDIDNVPLNIVSTIPQEDVVYLFGNTVDGKNVRLPLPLFQKIIKMTAANKLFIHLTDVVKKNSADFSMCFHAALICAKYKKERVSFNICSKDLGFEVLKDNIMEHGKGKFSVNMVPQPYPG